MTYPTPTVDVSLELLQALADRHISTGRAVHELIAQARRTLGTAENSLPEGVVSLDDYRRHHGRIA
ncbi:hypothetical protein [Nonomuraea typhae]|uniref:hypothetical protein n=1 Tax=Nonomuraea typhae TaxID=2603600 RepID=UPI0012F7A5E1|nr:hypothetical protein [Nonomuraea typhae]